MTVFRFSVVQFGQEWQIAQAVTRCPYTTEDMEGMEADISIKVGLKSVNVTLAGMLQSSSYIQKCVQKLAKLIFHFLAFH